MKKNVSDGIWTLDDRIEGNHANRYTTVLIQSQIAENKHDTTFAGYNKTRVGFFITLYTFW